MIKSLVSIAAFIFFVLMFWSCKKYEDGPFISFQSKSKRLINEWKLIEVRTTPDIVPQEISFTENDTQSFFFHFKDDQTMISIFYNLDTITDMTDGTWELSEYKNLIIMNFSNGGHSSLKIRRLTESELWVDGDYGYATLKFISSK